MFYSPPYIAAVLEFLKGDLKLFLEFAACFPSFEGIFFPAGEECWLMGVRALLPEAGDFPSPPDLSVFFGDSAALFCGDYWSLLLVDVIVRGILLLVAAGEDFLLRGDLLSFLRDASDVPLYDIYED